ncbi:MAG: YeeE/YedE family protein, partial [Bacteroidia bacterium]|nr:YeeE/YedE family protein [Bacteroidia bacterium]
MSIVEIISQPWHWAVSGAGIVFVMFLLLWFGGNFGASANLRTMCAIGGAGKNVSFFDYDWKAQLWNLVFVASAAVGGYIAVTFFSSPEPVQIAQATQDHLASMGIQTPQTISEGLGYVPSEIFAIENFFSLQNIILLVVGGFFVGFGTRYAGGCTSG